MPEISVIVPVYKVEKYIHRCIDSILNQTFSDFELILVDDGSPDNCGTICDQYAAKDSRVVVIHQENGGLSAARNAGIDWAFANSDSEWLSFIDSDDWVHQDYLKCLYDAVKIQAVLLAQCGSQDIHSESEIRMCEGKTVSRIVSPADLYLSPGAVVAMRKLIHKSLIGSLRYPLNKLHEDEYTTYKFVFAANRVAVVDNADFYYYFLRPDSIMRAEYTPKHLVVMQAYEEQLCYFREHALREMELFVASCYIRNISEQYRKCRDLDFERREEVLPVLKKKLV